MGVMCAPGIVQHHCDDPYRSFAGKEMKRMAALDPSSRVFYTLQECLKLNKYSMPELMD